MTYQTATPCIGICSTTYGDNVCRGCKRYYHEVIAWNTFADSQKQEVLARLDQLYAEVVPEFLQVQDSALLRRQCIKFSVKIKEDFCASSWAYQLLRKGADKINDLSRYGLQVNPNYSEHNLVHIYSQMEDTLLARCDVRLKQNDVIL